MATLNADGQTISLPCGKCGDQFAQTIGWFKAHGKFTWLNGLVCGI